MEGIDKLHMICSFYELTLRSRTWHTYLCLHSLTIIVVNVWFLYRKNIQWIDPQEKAMPLHTFQANVPSSLVNVKKQTRVRSSSESKLTPLPSKLLKVQSTPMLDIRLYRTDHMPSWNEKREGGWQYLNGYTYKQFLDLF